MKNLIAALVKFQSELKPVTKDSANPFFKSKYADLSSILEEVMPILSRNGLAISQTCRVIEKDSILQTRIMHISGEELVSEVYLPFIQDVQKMGSQITYYKRYSLQAALGVSTADEDDDGETAVRKPAPKQQPKQVPAPVQSPVQAPKQEVSQQTQKDIDELVAKITSELGIRTKGMSKEDKIKFMNEKLGIKNYSEIMSMKFAQLYEVCVKLTKI